MDPLQLAIVGFGLLIAGVVKGATGLGYSTCALPVLTLAVGLHTAMPLVLFPSLASNLTVMAGAGHFRATLRRFLWLYLALLPGLGLGLLLLLRIDQDAAASVLGLVIVAYCVFAFWRIDLRLAGRFERPLLAGRFERPLQIPVGLLNGLINGLTGSQIMPLVPYMLSLRLDPRRFVQAVNIGFTLSSLVMVVGLSQAGVLTGTTFLVSVAGIAPAMLGGWLGGKLRERLPEAKFRPLVLGVLMVLGAILMSRL
ncbi:MAG: sulfite exporter TauE/SafE family protein [Dongiaceae bacterium]